MYYGWFLKNLEKGCIRTNMHTTVYWNYKNFYSIDLTCVAIVTCWGPWPDNTVTQYLLWYVFVVFIVHRTAFNKSTGFLLGQSFRLAVKKRINYFSLLQKHVFIFKMWFFLETCFHFQNVKGFMSIFFFLFFWKTQL